jgi:hypothetical protein
MTGGNISCSDADETGRTEALHVVELPVESPGPGSCAYGCTLPGSARRTW